MEFVMKGLVTMAAVAVFLWIAERYGTGRAGWLTGLPSVSGPALLWLAHEQGIGFVIAAAGGTVIGCALCAVFAGVLGFLLRRLSLPSALLIAIAAMLALAGMLYWSQVDLWLGSAIAVVAIIAMHALLPVAPRTAPPVSRTFRQGSLLVALIAGVISGCLTAGGGVVGPWWSGVIASLPLIAAAVTITYGGGARARSIAFLRGYIGGLFGRIAFALCLVSTLSTAVPFLIAVVASSICCVLLSAAGCRWLARTHDWLARIARARQVGAAETGRNAESSSSQTLRCFSASTSSIGHVVWTRSAALALSLVIVCQPVDKQPGPSAPKRVPVPAIAADDLAQLNPFAINAFVFPVLENESDPPRFTDVQLALSCAGETDVYVDGSRSLAGLPVPAGAFVLRWNANGYCPFGKDGPVLNGRVDVLVFRDQ